LISKVKLEKIIHDNRDFKNKNKNNKIFIYICKELINKKM